jgi:hypothetical protein
MQHYRNSGFRCNPCAMSQAELLKFQAKQHGDIVTVEVPVKPVANAPVKKTVELKMNGKNGNLELADEDRIFADQVEAFIREVMREQQRRIAEAEVKAKKPNQVKLN